MDTSEHHVVTTSADVAQNGVSNGCVSNGVSQLSGGKFAPASAQEHDMGTPLHPMFTSVVVFLPC